MLQTESVEVVKKCAEEESSTECLLKQILEDLYPDDVKVVKKYAEAASRPKVCDLHYRDLSQEGTDWPACMGCTPCPRRTWRAARLPQLDLGTEGILPPPFSQWEG